MNTSNPQDLDTQTLHFVQGLNETQRKMLETAIDASRKCIFERQAAIEELQKQLDKLHVEWYTVTTLLYQRGYNREV